MRRGPAGVGGGGSTRGVPPRLLKVSTTLLACMASCSRGRREEQGCAQRMPASQRGASIQCMGM